ncbi:MAG TPA: hypothetical protein VLX85_10050 [Stellaceae bacterium]|nr:hypothetical protein [Stellaceae bacterium]
MSSSIFGVFAALLALLGVVLAANAIDVGMMTFGFGLLVFGVWFVFWLIKDHWDEQERGNAQTH